MRLSDIFRRSILCTALMASTPVVAATACDMDALSEPAAFCEIPVSGGHFERGIGDWKGGMVRAITSPVDPAAAAASMDPGGALVKEVPIPQSATQRGDITLYNLTVTVHADGEGGRIGVSATMMDKRFSPRTVLNEFVDLSPGVNTIPVNFSGVNTVQPPQLLIGISRDDRAAATAVSILSVTAGQRSQRID